MALKLCGIDELSYGTSTQYLQTAELTSAQHFINADIDDVGIKSAHVIQEKFTAPVFSIQEFSEVSLSGFRMLSIGDRHFNERSFNEPELANNSFSTRILSGYSENVKFNEDGSIFRKNIKEIDCDGAWVLATDQPSNFGHWLMYVLPKLVLTKKFIGAPRSIFLHCKPGWMTDVIKCFGEGVDILHQDASSHYLLHNVLIPSMPVPHFMFREEVNAAFDPFIEESIEKYPSTPEKIYISRRYQSILSPGHRVFENETELVENLIQQGFKEIIPESLSFQEQVATFANARIIIGAGGSNMFSCYFARKAALIVDLEATDYFIKQHSRMLSSSGSNYAILLGETTGRGVRPKGHPNWRINVNAVLSWIKRVA